MVSREEGVRGPGDVGSGSWAEVFQISSTPRSQRHTQKTEQGVGTEEEPSGVPSGFRMPGIGSSKLFFVGENWLVKISFP